MAGRAARPSTGRRSVTSRTAVYSLVLLPVLLTAAVVAFVLLVGAQPSAAACGGTPGGGVDVRGLPAGSVAGYRGEQLANAAKILAAGKAVGLDVKGQTIGVMTAMGEAGLLVLNRGDAAGPDSRGLFQQRDNGAWGSLADRMDPVRSASNFFHALQGVPGWQSMSPTQAAHRVQGNADPGYYTQFWNPALQVVAALSGSQVTGLAADTGGQVCTSAAPGTGVVAPGGWARPASGPLTQPYGLRNGRDAGGHPGIDIAPPCNAPIYAAAAGTVADAGPASGFGNWIVLDHGGGVITVYGHMYNDGLLVRTGDTVKAGQQIARVGSNGESTGCHLHFEVHLNGTRTDPAAWLASHGAPIQ